jgi:hypothetical protein
MLLFADTPRIVVSGPMHDTLLAHGDRPPPDQMLAPIKPTLVRISTNDEAKIRAALALALDGTIRPK